MQKISALLSKMTLILSAIGLTAMTLIIGWQVFARYVLQASPSWTEQAALYLMIWFILFAAAVGVREGFNIQITVFRDLLGQPVRKYVKIFSHLVVMFFGFVMIYAGAQLAVLTWHHVIPTIGLPRGSIYIPVSISGMLISFFSVEHIMAEISDGEVSTQWNS